MDQIILDELAALRVILIDLDQRLNDFQGTVELQLSEISEQINKLSPEPIE